MKFRVYSAKYMQAKTVAATVKNTLGGLLKNCERPVPLSFVVGSVEESAERGTR